MPSSLVASVQVSSAFFGIQWTFLVRHTATTGRRGRRVLEVDSSCFSGDWNVMPTASLYPYKCSKRFWAILLFCLRKYSHPPRTLPNRDSRNFFLGTSI